jgi:hypothetical protein
MISHQAVCKIDDETYHNSRLFCFDAFHQRHDLLLYSKFVEHLATAEFRGVVRDGNTIQTIADGVVVSGATTQSIESFETTNLDAKRVCVSEDSSNYREQLVLDSTVVESRQDGRQG